MQKLFLLIGFVFFTTGMFAQSASTIKKILNKAEKQLENEDNNNEVYSVFKKYETYLSPNQQHYLAHCYAAEFCSANTNSNNKKKSIQLLKSAAQNGILCAQLNLAYCYEVGMDVKKDSTKAMFWYEKAVQKNDAFAQFILATKYLEGIITKKDLLKSIDLFKKSASQNYGLANISLGFMYQYSIGVEKNDSLSNFYFANFTNEKYNPFKKENYTNHLSTTCSDIKCTIWFPDYFLTNDIIIEQLKYLLPMVDTSKCKVAINSFGNESYDAQYLSWQRSNSLIKYLIDIEKINPEKLIMNFGGNEIYNSSSIQFVDENTKGPTRIPPPVGSLLNHRFDVCGHAHFSP